MWKDGYEREWEMLPQLCNFDVGGGQGAGLGRGGGRGDVSLRGRGDLVAVLTTHLLRARRLYFNTLCSLFFSCVSRVPFVSFSLALCDETAFTNVSYTNANAT